MPIGSARPGGAGRRGRRGTNVCASVLACVLAAPAWAGDAAPSILGRWRRDDERPGQPAGGSFSRLEFLPRGKVVGLRFMAHAFSHGGEALESGYGRYRVRGSSLSVTPPGRLESDGWPGQGEVDGSAYRCGLAIDAASASLALSRCPLSGTWVREAEAHDAAGR